jgi:hypothetical protein
MTINSQHINEAGFMLAPALDYCHRGNAVIPNWKSDEALGPSEIVLNPFSRAQDHAKVFVSITIEAE